MVRASPENETALLDQGRDRIDCSDFVRLVCNHAHVAHFGAIGEGSDHVFDQRFARHWHDAFLRDARRLG